MIRELEQLTLPLTTSEWNGYQWYRPISVQSYTSTPCFSMDWWSTTFANDKRTDPAAHPAASHGHRLLGDLSTGSLPWGLGCGASVRKVVPQRPKNVPSRSWLPKLGHGVPLFCDTHMISYVLFCADMFKTWNHVHWRSYVCIENYGNCGYTCFD